MTVPSLTVYFFARVGRWWRGCACVSLSMDLPLGDSAHRRLVELSVLHVGMRCSGPAASAFYIGKVVHEFTNKPGG